MLFIDSRGGFSQLIAGSFLSVPVETGINSLDLFHLQDCNRAVVKRCFVACL
jgi:hypothetical protein